MRRTKGLALIHFENNGCLVPTTSEVRSSYNLARQSFSARLILAPTEGGLMATPAERSVDWLQRLYAVVIGLALTEGFKNIVNATNSALPNASIFERVLRVETWPFIALIFTIVPFFHGANRHLDDLYVFRNATVKDFALLIDFLFFFIQGAVFYWMALVIQNPRHFFQVYCALLVLDIVWAMSVFFYAEAGWKRVKTWVWINLIAFSVAALFLATPLLNANAQVHAVGVVAVVRTVFDYAYQWHSYY